MKRLIPAAVIFLFVISCCLAGNFGIKKICSGINKNVETCIDLCNDGKWDQLKTETQDLSDKWNSAKTMLSAFVNNEKVSNISQSVSRLSVYANHKSRTDYLSECSDISFFLSEIKNEEMLRAESFY